MKKLPIFLLLLAFGCTNPPYKGDEIVGADEFVIDSYKIKEGKFAILEMEGRAFPQLSPEYLQEYTDLVKNGDVLSVIFYSTKDKEIGTLIKEISQDQGFVVSDGKVTLPVIGAVEVVNMPLQGAKAKITQAFTQKFDNAEVFLSYKERPADSVEITGLVQKTNIIADGKKRLFDVLSESQIAASADLFRSYVLRGNELLPVDLYKLIKEGDSSQNIVMRGGDKVYIAEGSASNVMILGEVENQRVLEMPNGFMSLKLAIAAAGGLNENGDRRHVQVIRGGIINPKIYSLNWRHVVRLPNDSLMLMPGDIVYVAATPIAEWNRFVNKVIPTLIAIDLGRKGSLSVNAR